MVVSDAKQARAIRDQAPIVGALVPHEAMDTTESSRTDPDPVDQPPVTMTDAIKQQVSKQVKKVAEAARSARPFPVLNMFPPEDASPPVGVTLQHLPAAVRGCKKPLSTAETSGLGRTTMAVLLGPMPILTIAQAMGAQQSQPLPLRPVQHALDEPPGSKIKNKPRAPREEPLNCNDLPSADRAATAPGVPLTKGTA